MPKQLSSPCCILKVKTRNSLTFSKRPLNGTELFNHMHCSMSTVSSISFPAGLCELIGTEFVFSKGHAVAICLQFVCSEIKKMADSVLRPGMVSHNFQFGSLKGS